MDTNCGVSVNLSQLPNSTTPLHIVLWKGVDSANPTVKSLGSPAPVPVAAVSLENDETIKRLLHRITVLESMVSGLLETQKSSIWFPQGLRPTPAGIEVVSRRESMGGESDIGTVLSQLVRPSDIRTVSIAPVEMHSRAATGPEPEAEETDATEGLEEEAAEVVEEEVVEEVVEEAEEVVEEVVEEAEEAVEETVEEEAVEEEAAEEVVEEAEEAVEEEAVEEAEEAVEEAEEAVEEVVEEAAEEEVTEYKEIQWKGQTYYVDGEQQVYEMDSDGDLIDTPIGVWREATQKLVRYKAAP